eukprot:Opistho-2@82410
MVHCTNSRQAMPAAPSTSLLVDLALQGGGAHGAFTWGVLDRLLEEPWLAFDGISGTSAGAMNAAQRPCSRWRRWREGGAGGFLEAGLRRLGLQPDTPRADGLAHRSVDFGQLADPCTLR